MVRVELLWSPQGEPVLRIPNEMEIIKLKWGSPPATKIASPRETRGVDGKSFILQCDAGCDGPFLIWKQL